MLTPKTLVAKISTGIAESSRLGEQRSNSRSVCSLQNEEGGMEVGGVDHKRVCVSWKLQSTETQK